MNSDKINNKKRRIYSPKQTPTKSEFKRHEVELVVSNDFFTLQRLWPQDEKAIAGAPFTQKWKAHWAKAARLTGTTGEKLFPGATKAYKRFKDPDGFNALETLASKGADPNFILYLLVKYLWNDRVPSRSHIAPAFGYYSTLLDAVDVVKSGFANRSEYIAAASSANRILIPQFIMPDQWEALDEKAISHSLSRLKEFARSMIELPDVHQHKRHTAKDKVNRFIFFMYHYLKCKTGGPQWEHFWNLLVSADAIDGKSPKNNKDPQLKSHIRSFEQNCPREAKFILFWLNKISKV